MSAGWIIPGLGASSLRQATRTNGPVHIYVSNNNGNDFTGLGTQDKPLKSLEFAEILIPDIVDHPITISLDRGTFPLPDSGVWLQSRILNSTIRIIGDAAWDPSVNGVLHAEPAGAGTVANLIKQTGLVVNAFRGKTLEATTGGVLQRRTIKSNTATDVIPCEVFNPVPNPGDAVRIYEPRAAIQIPEVVPPATTIDEYQFAASMVSAAVRQFDGTSSPGVLNGGVVPQTGLIVENIAFLTSSSYQALSLGSGRAFMYGVEFREPLPGSFAPLIEAIDAQLYLGISLNDRIFDQGWGLGTSETHIQSPIALADGLQSLVQGYFAGNMAAPSPSVPGGTVIMWGGFATRVLLQFGYFNAFGNSDSTIPFTLESQAGPAVDVFPSTNSGPGTTPIACLSFACEATSVGTGPTIRARNNGKIYLGNTVTGGPNAGGIAVSAEAGATIWVQANPAFGAAGDLWKTPNTAGAVKAAFVPGFAVVDLVDTSAIIVEA